MRTLVVVASRHGATRDIADAICRELVANSIACIQLDATDDPDPSDYDAVIIGSAVYYGRWLKPARRYVHKHQQTLYQRAVWAFSSGPADARPPAQSGTRGTPDLLGPISPVEHVTFGGRIDTHRLSRLERLVVRAIGTGDADYRDWSVIQTWARSIAATLSANRSG